MQSPLRGSGSVLVALVMGVVAAPFEAHAAEPTAAPTAAAPTAAAATEAANHDVAATSEPPRPSPPETGHARAEGDENFGGDPDTAGTYTIRTLIQTRAQQSFVVINPALEARIRGEAFNPQVATNAIDYLRTTKRSDDGIRLNRVFLRATAQPTESFGVKMLVDFAELVRGKEKKALKLAYAELTPRPSFGFSVGLFKIPFSLLELLPIADFEFAESGPTDKLLKNLGFAGRDVGGMVSLAPFKKKKLLRLNAGAFEGNASGPQSTRGPGILAARAASRVFKGLRLGADVVWRPQVTKDWKDTVAFEKFQSGRAVSADAIIDVGPLQVRGEWVYGDRTDGELFVPETLRRRATARTFMSAWALAAARVPIGGMVLMPAVRGEWLDADRESNLGRVLYGTVSLGLDVLPTARLLLDFSRTKVDPGTYNIDYETGLYDVDATSVVAQVQIKL